MELSLRVEQLLHQNAPDYEISKVVKQANEAYVKTLPETFTHNGGKHFLVQHTRMIDRILTVIYKAVVRKLFGEYLPMRANIPVAIVALGSYGREQMCVYSDIDLMIVYEDMPGFQMQLIVERILYTAWDAGLNLGHRVHEVNDLCEAAQSDETIKSALLESRFVIGSKFLWTKVENQLESIRHTDQSLYITHKLEEAKKRQEKFPISMEPNLKEGVGGMRDANLVFWIGNIRYGINSVKELVGTIIDEEDFQEYRFSLDYIFRLRSALHLAAGKKEDTLRLEYIPSILRRLGQDDGGDKKAQIELVAKATRALNLVKLHTRIWTYQLNKPVSVNPANIKRLRKARSAPGIYHLDNLLLTTIKQPQTMQFWLTQLLARADQRFDAHETIIAAISHSLPAKPWQEEHAPLIRQIFDKAYAGDIIWTLYESQHLDQVLPIFKHVIYMPQFDGYHTNPVDTHSIKALQNLDRLEHRMLKDLFNNLPREYQSLLKMVALLHDAGKGRTRDHHDVGGELFRHFGKYLGLDETLIKDAVILIKYHTRMTRTIHNRDIYNEAVVAKFVAPLKTQRLLDMLFVLTYCDVNAVADNIYNSYMNRQLTLLYNTASALLTNQEILDETTKRIRREQQFRKNEAYLGLPRTVQKKIRSIESNLFFLNYTTNEIMDISQRALATEAYSTKIERGEGLRIEIIRKTNIRLGYLLGKLSHLDLVGMRVFRLFDKIKLIVLEFKEDIEDEDMTYLMQLIDSAFKTTGTVRLKKPEIKPDEIMINYDHSPTYASMQIKTSNQRGLMAYVVDYFDNHGIDISTATISTRKYRVNDLLFLDKNASFSNIIHQVINELTLPSLT